MTQRCRRILMFVGIGNTRMARWNDDPQDLPHAIDRAVASTVEGLLVGQNQDGGWGERREPGRTNRDEPALSGVATRIARNWRMPKMCKPLELCLHF